MNEIHTPASAIEEAFSLPARYYTDPEILALEHERIFYRCWNFAGYVSQCRERGAYLTCRVGEESIAVLRGEDGKLRAFYNVCRHRGHPLLEGAGRLDAIVCPYHAWRYATDGSLRYARHSDQIPSFDAARFCLKQVRVEEFCGLVFVNLDAEAAPLSDQVPTLAEDLRGYEPRLDALHLVHRAEVRIASNWKNVVDNYNENYHTPVVHPVLSSMLTDDYRVVANGLYVRHRSSTAAGLAGGFDVNAARYDTHHNWWLWPNLCLMSFPDGGFRVLHIMPDGPDRSRETYDFYLPCADPSEAEWRQIHFSVDVINAEDIGVCEGIQRGLRSRGYEPSYIMLDPERRGWSEHAVLHFKDLILAALEG